MCGIVGFIDRMNQNDKSKTLEEMMNTIVHRGPSSSGEFIDEGAAIGFRRLSIIDLEGGDQPIFNEDKSKLITFNGEIYNFRELREDLIAKGHDFTTHADTEVLLHGYEEYGVELLQKLRGMFAFVIWDREKQELFGARDHFGIKPLYYTQMGGTFMYGSEIKSFLKHPNFKKELNKGEKKHADFMDGDRHIFCRNGSRAWNGLCRYECCSCDQSHAHHISWDGSLYGGRYCFVIGCTGKCGIRVCIWKE